MEDITLTAAETPYEDNAGFGINELPVEDTVSFSIDGESGSADLSGMAVEGDSMESGFETEILGDGMPPEELKEPRDNVRHHSDHTFENNVTIGGTLRTKRWVHPHGCVFQTKEKLLEEYPTPTKGMWGFVGTSFPGKVWICEEDGKWREADPTTLGRDEVRELLKDYATEEWVKSELQKYLAEDGELKEHLTEADHADSAYTLDADSPVRDEFLSSQDDDTASGRISFKKGARFGDFVSGLYGGMGGQIDAAGNGELESLIVRTTLTVMEAVINRQSIEAGDAIFSEGDTIESTEYAGLNADGTTRWWIDIKPRYDGYITPIQPGMVVRGTVNNLFDAAQPGTPLSYYTSWMRVNSLELGTAGNRLNVTLYPPDEVPSGQNFPPCPLMVLARWGHQTVDAFQRLFRISSHEGSIVRYEGVTKPILDLGNIASFIGRCPEGMFGDVPGISPGDEIAYFKVVLGNFIQLDYKGRPIPSVIYTGEYDPTRVYHCAYIRTDPDTGRRDCITETCTYKGCIWQCAKDGISGIPPDFGTTYWAFTQGNHEFVVDFEERQVLYDESNLDLFDATLTLTARLYNQDVLPHILPHNVAWSRESYDSSGALRAASDAAWTPRTDRGNTRLLLDKSDLSFDGTSISKITFTARVALDDTKVASAAVEFTG